MVMWHQLSLLLWKNWKLQARKPIVTLLEIVLPALFCLLLLLFRDATTSTVISTPTTFPSYDLQKLPRTVPPVFRIAYAPQTNLTSGVVKRACRLAMSSSYGSVLCTMGILTTGFESEEKLVKFMTSSNGSQNLLDTFLCGIVFTGSNYTSSLPTSISYKLRFSSSLRFKNPSSGAQFWETGYTFPEYLAPGPRQQANNYGSSPDYYSEGFLTMQNAINRALIERLRPRISSTSDFGRLEVLMQRFPYPPYINDIFLVVLQIQLPFLIMLSLVFVALQIPKELVHEKELKIKESMKMMGLKNWLHWLGWFIKYMTFFGLTAVIMAIILSPPGLSPDNKLRILRYTDFSIVLVYFLLYMLSTICFCFMVSAFFNKANAAAAAGGILFFLSYMPYLFIYTSYQLLNRDVKIASCLLNNNAMALGAYIISKFEGTGVGSQWYNIGQPVSIDDDFTLLHTFVMMAADSFIYLLIMWYVEAVFPGNYGVPRPWYFFIQPEYWCGTQSNHKMYVSANGTNGTQPHKRSEFFEMDPANFKAGVQIRGLSKVFSGKTGKKTAVNQMDLNLYEGQITALLGHNGAGKTTTMFMLTGFLPPTAGTAIVNGFDIREDISGVRSSLGLCPQHDILIDNLTVEEHLYFFADLKECPKKRLKAEVDYYIKTLGLEEKRLAYAQTLSGGQKRRLSVGIALIGNSKVVILDEPTSGMDPSGRRLMWDVLQKQRAGRTIILSTHFMDEADCLGDRIAIMADGVVQCCGSSLFLKNKYGDGYRMTMVKKQQCSIGAVTAVIKRHVPYAKLQSNVGTELAFVLPNESATSFPNLFAELEERKDELGLAGYGASVTTLEEVFLKVGESSSGINGQEMNREIAQSLETASSSFNPEESVLTSMRSLNRTTGFALSLQQFKAMLLKRILHTWRNRILTLSQLLLPTFFTIITAAIMTNLPSETSYPQFDLTINKYASTKIFHDPFEHGNSSASLLATSYAAQFDSSGQDVRRVDNASQAIIKAGEESIGAYTFRHVVAASFANLSNGTEFLLTATAMFNAQPYHSAAVSLAHVSNALVHHYVNASCSIQTANHPLPQTAESRAQAAMSQFNAQSFAYSSNLVFGMAFLGSSFVVFLIRERSAKVKHSQFVSGVKWYNFWMSTFLWDMVNYMVPSLLLLAVVEAFEVEELAGSQVGYLLLLLIAYGMALLPNMYLIHYLFTGPATGYVVVTFYNIVTGITPSLVITILNSINEKDLAEVLRWVFHVLFPNYNLAEGVTNMFENHQFLDLCTNVIPAAYNRSLNQICNLLVQSNATLPCCKDVPAACGNTCLQFQENYMSIEPLGIGRALLFLFTQCFVLWLLVFLVESGAARELLYKCRRVKMIFPDVEEQIAEDDDVVRERTRVKCECSAATSPVIISGLTKYFTSHPAVNNLFVGIPEGECFGLLGVNGAGKTTTFRMLTGDETLSAGNAILNGHSIRRDIANVHKTIGYCPQFDALIDQMTGEETLYLYGRLRGIPETELGNVVNGLLKTFMLAPHAKKLTANYSGGNKRKLSSAIAFIGSPPIVFLDEPTTGMDPVARRMMWDVLAQVRDAGTTLVLTSHSMEECEALCTRMAIMVNGQFKCLGSTQHLKNKFGRGYTIIARVGHPANGTAPDAKPLCLQVEQSFPGSVLKDLHQNTVHYHVPSSLSTSWAKLFSFLENAKVMLGIEDYAVSQTTLEEVFIDFARSQVDPEEEDGVHDLHASCCSRFKSSFKSSFSCWPTEIVVGENLLAMLKVD